MTSTAAADTPTAASADYVLLGIAVFAVSTSAPLIRYAAAPALAIAMWRTVLAVPVVGLLALGRRRPDRRERRLIAVAGALLALHFAVWIPSISYTSVASSVALVATQPIWAAMIARARGEHVERAVWIGIGIALVGVVILTGVDLQLSSRALFGDLLALAGGLCAASYVTVGAEVRKTVDTAVYTAGCYAVGGAVLLVLCVVTRRELTGFDSGTWLAILGLVLGAQLLGHTLLNQVLRTISATSVSVAILFEVIGASVIAAIAFSETPPLAAAPAALLILVGTVVVIRSGRRRPIEGVPLA
ncbi:DMT family transporter [Actinospongicola halichondriae]|uniref:DMT family transporter n=1 Tax=Actinospongicola halichondriae TaxID=3236844 RepID=UPI003D5D3C55